MSLCLSGFQGKGEGAEGGGCPWKFLLTDSRGFGETSLELCRGYGGSKSSLEINLRRRFEHSETERWKRGGNRFPDSYGETGGQNPPALRRRIIHTCSFPRLFKRNAPRGAREAPLGDEYLLTQRRRLRPPPLPPGGAPRAPDTPRRRDPAPRPAEGTPTAPLPPRTPPLRVCLNAKVAVYEFPWVKFQTLSTNYLDRSPV